MVPNGTKCCKLAGGETLSSRRAPALCARDPFSENAASWEFTSNHFRCICLSVELLDSSALAAPAAGRQAVLSLSHPRLVLLFRPELPRPPAVHLRRQAGRMLLLAVTREAAQRGDARCEAALCSRRTFNRQRRSSLRQSEGR